jgi:cytochrome c biogenesis protein CcmG/thiol:disulfide interchange protein DsbE
MANQVEPSKVEPSQTEPGSAGSAAPQSPRRDQVSWRSAVADVWQSATRHKVVSVVIALCVVGSLAAIGVIGSTSHPAASSASGGAASSATGGGAGAEVVANGPAPAFSLPALGQTGKTVSLTAYQGKPVIVNFFASWCVPCKAETPRLAAFYRTEQGQVPLIGLDERDLQASALKFTQADKVGYPVGFDPEMTVASAYNTGALPQTFFLNAQHRVVYRVFGAITVAELNRGILLATKDQ